MGKKIEGSYATIEETVQTVHRLLKDGDYLSSDILILTNRANREKLEELTSVQIEKVSTIEDKSTWERVKKMFSSEGDEATLEKYGIEMHEAVRFEEDLRNGRYIVIVENVTQNKSSKSKVTSVSDAIVDARDEQKSDPQVENEKDRWVMQSGEGVETEDPLLNGTVDRGPIYGVVNDEPSTEERKERTE